MIMENRYKRGLKHLIEDVEYIICPYCNQKKKWLNYFHLKQHNKTIDDVRKEFSTTPTMTLKEAKNRQRARKESTEKIRRTCNEKYGGIGFASKELEDKSRTEIEKIYGNRNIMKTEHGKQFFVGDKNPQKTPEARKRTSETMKGRPSKLKEKTYEEILGEQKTFQRKKELKRSGAIGQSLTSKISKPQLELYKQIKQQYPTAILEYPILDYCLDIAVPEEKLCFEYDGSYWHQDKEKDKKRDEILNKLGWKVIRFRDNFPLI